VQATLTDPIPVAAIPLAAAEIAELAEKLGASCTALRDGMSCGRPSPNPAITEGCHQAAWLAGCIRRALPALKAAAAAGARLRELK
jgi:hypothetical protein